MQFPHIVKTTGIAGGLRRPYKGLVPATPQGVRKIRQSHNFHWLAPLWGAFLFAFVYWLTRKRVHILFDAALI